MTVAKLLIGNLILKQWREKQARLNRQGKEASALQTMARRKKNPCEKVGTLLHAISCKELLELEKAKKEKEQSALKERERAALASP